MERFLDDKVALVTGSSRGIGRAIALAFAQRGADLCVHCHGRLDEAHSVQRLVEAAGRRSITVCADIANPEQTTELIDEVKRSFGRLDILVNNAAYVAHHRLPGAELAVIHRIIDVNLKGAFNCIVASLPLLQTTKGLIINIGALNSRAISAAGSAYAASKAGLVAMTTNLAHDLGPMGIRVNTLAPPLTETDMGRWAQTETGLATAGLGAHQRAAKASEVAEMVSLMCSPAAAYLSGETIYMGGGFCERPQSAGQSSGDGHP